MRRKTQIGVPVIPCPQLEGVDVGRGARALQSTRQAKVERASQDRKNDNICLDPALLKKACAELSCHDAFSGNENPSPRPIQFPISQDDLRDYSERKCDEAAY